MNPEETQPNYKQKARELGWKALAFLGDHPVLRGMLVGFLLGLFVAWIV